MTNLSLTFPLIYLALYAMAMLMVGAFTRNARLVGALTCFGLSMLVVPLLTKPAIGQVVAVGYGPLLSLSPFTNLAQFILVILAALASLLNEPYYTPRKAYRPESYVLLLLSVAGMFVLTTASDMLTVYLGLELMSFPLYIMAAMLRDNARSSEAALKYFVLGGLTSGFFLFGVSLIYAAVGSTQYSALLVALGQGIQPLLLVGVVLVLMAFVFKLSLVPFHMWTPDVYQGAPLPVTATMAALPKVAAVVALIRLLDGPLVGLEDMWQPALAVLAVASMLVGSVVAIVQNNLKRLLAWSTIANVGFVMAGVVASNVEGHSGVLFYLAVYGLTVLGLFAALVELKSPAHGQLGFVPPSATIDDLRGLARTRPMLAGAMLVLLFSLAGVPPFAGFMAKFAVFAAAVKAGFVWLAVAGVISSVVAVFYSLWLVKVMYFDLPGEAPVLPSGNQSQSPLMVIVLVALAAVVLFGVFPSALATLTFPAATALF